IRHPTAAELTASIGFTRNDAVGLIDADQVREEVAAGRCRPEWTWLAIDDSRIVARALWWGRADSEHPLALGCLWVLPDVPDRVALATKLLSRGHAEFNPQPEYQLILPTAGRGTDPDIEDAVAW